MVEIFFYLGPIGFPFVHETVDVLLELFLLDGPFLARGIDLGPLVFLRVQLGGIGRDEQYLYFILVLLEPFAELLGLVRRVVAHLTDGQVFGQTTRRVGFCNRTGTMENIAVREIWPRKTLPLKLMLFVF